MKLYIANGTYVGTQAEAKKLDRDYEPVEVPTDKEGLIAYLNVSKFVTQPEPFAKTEVIRTDSLLDDIIGSDPAPLPPGKLSYIEQSIKLDEAWEELPLARKLHFAALAMEDARQALPAVENLLD